MKLEPKFGEIIKVNADKSLTVPDKVVIPFIEGDGIGVDISPVMIRVIDAAVEKAYGGKRKIDWLEIYMGEKASRLCGGNYLPEESLAAIKKYIVAIKGPLTTPVGEGFRSLNVAIRQILDLYVCLRPVKYFTGTPSALKKPENIDMVIFRENSEDIYAGIEWEASTPEVKKMIDFLLTEMKVTQLVFPETTSIGIKPVSEDGSKRLIRKTMQYAIDNDLPSVTLVHKGNIMKFTEGAFKNWGYEVAREEFGATLLDGGPWCEMINPITNNKIIIKDVIADAFLQQIILRPSEYSAIATLNLNGDYISDALAALVGGIGIAPGANLNDKLAVFEATHGTAPKYAGQDKVNPGSLILSGEMMLTHLGWSKAAKLVNNSMSETIYKKIITYDFARLLDNVEPVSCSEFGDAMIRNIVASA